MVGVGTEDSVKGSWPPEASYHKLVARKGWKPFREEACYRLPSWAKAQTALIQNSTEHLTFNEWTEDRLLSR
ncbi:unnamed protein product [Clonostachys rosea f. rosea IK726]|uniref:Uncharacterized protein n=1 Tax=Clonostachys rosea f. rosea IK726 TaxID=1349383 RepID=A0ACA9TZ98_BIOOC|nr:unnamed protein product [Clonostachys rosea f. rosea IK726]